MPKIIKADSWRWFRSELVRLLGEEQSAALWEELRQRRIVERQAEQHSHAARELAYYERKLQEARAMGGPTKQIEQAIARRKERLEK